MLGLSEQECYMLLNGIFSHHGVSNTVLTQFASWLVQY